MILAPFSSYRNIDFCQLLSDLKHMGINRIEVDNSLYKLDDLKEEMVASAKKFNVY